MQKEPIRLNKYYQQIILACKGWNEVYSTRNTIERILSQHLGIDRKYIEQYHVYKNLVDIVKATNPKALDRLYYYLFLDCDSISADKMINRLIGILSSLQVVEGDRELIVLEYDEAIINGIYGSEV